MARGDMIIFDSFLLNLGDSTIHDLDTHTFNVGLIDNTATVPDRNTPDPCWGAGGTTNLLARQVGTAGGYTGPVALLTPSFTEVVADTTIRWDADETNLSWSLHASGATDIYYAIIYNDSATNKNCCAAIDMGGPVSLQAGDVTITLNANGIFQISI